MKSFDKNIGFGKDNICTIRRDYEKNLIKLRKNVNELFFNHHFSKSMIAKKKRVSRNFVIKWTGDSMQDFTLDRRGWQQGKRRKWTNEDEIRIKRIHNDLEENPLKFYTGATAIEQEWRKQYPEIPLPPLRTIGQILRDLGLSDKRKKGRNKGASRYLCYPEYTIYELLGRHNCPLHQGGRVLEADFIGKKYITGRTEPINFITFSFKKEPRLRYFKRVDGQTADNFIEQCKHFFDGFEKPDFIKVDNCLATIGSASGKRNISRVMKFLLENEVIPIFAVPRKPFSQASIEGNNSVFSRRFWNRIEFKSIQEVDMKLEWFNKASERYTGYKLPEVNLKERKEFSPKVYFIRQVREDNQHSDEAYIDILNDKVFLSKEYINYFLLAEWGLKQEELCIYLEKEQKPEVVKRQLFKINEESKEKIKNLLKK